MSKENGGPASALSGEVMSNETEQKQSFWEAYPATEKQIEAALKMRDEGMRAYEISLAVGVDRSGLLYWMHEYKRGRRWESTPNAELRGASRLHGEASLSNDVLCGVGDKADGGESV